MSKEVAYICNGKADCRSSPTCALNGGDCTRTLDVEHAANFKQVYESDNYMELGYFDYLEKAGTYKLVSWNVPVGELAPVTSLLARVCGSKDCYYVDSVGKKDGDPYVVKAWMTEEEVDTVRDILGSIQR